MLTELPPLARCAPFLSDLSNGCENLASTMDFLFLIIEAGFRRACREIPAGSAAEFGVPGWITIRVY
jgi:hypothetical protein